MISINRYLAMMLILVSAAAPGIAAVPDTQVLAQDLQKLRVPGKVSSVAWTRRDGSCTLQVVLQMPLEFQIAAKVAAQRAAAGQAGAVLSTPKLPQVQAWLLRMDGTVISRSSGSPAFPEAVRASDGVPLEVKYSFPQSAAQEAIAVAIMVDGAYYIEQLQPFADGGA